MFIIYGSNEFSWLTDVLIPILIEFIAVFLGVLIGSIITKRQDSVQLFRMEDKLVEELLRIKKELLAVKDKEDYVFFYNTPNWEIYLASGGLTSFYTLDKLKSKRKKAVAKRCKSIIDVYYEISYARNLEDSYYLLLSKAQSESIDMEYCRKMDELRKEEKDIIFELIKPFEGSEK